jgi:hypothetical protein
MNERMNECMNNEKCLQKIRHFGKESVGTMPNNDAGFSALLSCTAEHDINIH